MLRTGKEYPYVLINGFEDDIRTPLWNVLKFANRFRNMVSCERIQNLPLFVDENKKLFLNIESGHHSGLSDKKEIVNQNLFKLCFNEFAILGTNQVQKTYKMKNPII